MKEIFSHNTVDTGAKRPYHVTICCIEEGGMVVSRGISICSCSDQYNKRLGNRIARGRAYKAANRGQNSNHIRDKIYYIAPFNYKCEFMPLLPKQVI